jgi:aspartate racemase
MAGERLHMKTVGIIGGLGPETTAHFCLNIIKQCEDMGAPSRPPLLSWNIPLPLEIERDLILHSRGEERYVPLLIEAAQKLERGGADFLVMPCNSLHIFVEQIGDSVSIPVLSIIEVACEHLGSQGIQRVGVLATATTVQSGMFQKALRLRGIEAVLPSISDQEMLAKIILNIIEGKSTQADERELEGMSMRIGVQTMLLACTDLQLLMQEKEGVEIIDTMHLLAGAASKESLVGPEA